MKTLLILLCGLLCFNINGQAQKSGSDKQLVTIYDSLMKANGIKPLQVSQKRDDIISNEGYETSFMAIRKNFKRINSWPNNKWTSIVSKDLDESEEGGEATFYYDKKELKKIIARYYGESGQILIEYYLMNGKLSFVFQKEMVYNRPLFYSEANAEENNDTVAFDINKSEIMEDRSYFKNDILLHQISNQDCGAPWASSYLLEEQKRILDKFNALVKLSTK